MMVFLYLGCILIILAFIIRYYWRENIRKNRMPHEEFQDLKFWVPDDELMIKKFNETYYYKYKYVTSDWTLVVEQHNGSYIELDLLDFKYNWTLDSISNTDLEHRQKIMEQERLKNPNDRYTLFLEELQREFGKMIEDEYKMIDKLEDEPTSRGNPPVNQRVLDRVLQKIREQDKHDAIDKNQLPRFRV